MLHFELNRYLVLYYMVGWIRGIGYAFSHGSRRLWAKSIYKPSVVISRTEFLKVGGLCDLSI